MPIPAGIFASILNNSERRIDRHVRSEREIPYIHVSSLINASLYGTFCAREFTLRYLEKIPPAGSSVPPKFDVLYDTGHILGERAVIKFLRRSADYAKYAWGDWTCVCERTRVTFSHKPDMQCEHCLQPVNVYKESDIRDETLRVVGHADLLLRDEDELIYVYEIKSIDRADVDFDALEAPLGDHLLQGSFYYWLLIALGYKVHPYIRVVYIDRSTNQLYRAKPYKEFSVKRVSAPRIKRLAGKAKSAIRGCTTKVLPKRICDTITDSRAVQCKMAISCFSRRLRTAKFIE